MSDQPDAVLMEQIVVLYVYEIIQMYFTYRL